jgi:hypothetical protein
MSQTQIQTCQIWIKENLTPTQEINKQSEKSYRLKHIIENWSAVKQIDCPFISERSLITAMQESGYLFDGEHFNAEYVGVRTHSGEIPYRVMEWRQVVYLLNSDENSSPQASKVALV